MLSLSLLRLIRAQREIRTRAEIREKGDGGFMFTILNVALFNTLSTCLKFALTGKPLEGRRRWYFEQHSCAPRRACLCRIGINLIYSHILVS